MYQSISFIKLGSILATVVIMLLQGCATGPSYTEPGYYEGLHTVQQGETLSSIANAYGLDYKTVAALNGIPAPYLIYPGQSIQVYVYSAGDYNEGSSTSLPVPINTPVQPRKLKEQQTKKFYPPTGSSQSSKKPQYHTVKQGDTLYAIAKRYGKDYRQIADWNQISPPYQLQVGQRLHLSPTHQTEQASISPSKVKKSSSPSKVKKSSTPSKVKKGTTTHTVQRGDTISNIAQLYGYSVGEIAYWNGLKPPYSLSRGRRLRVAPWASTSSRQALTTQSSSNRSVYHTVAKGDTLYSFSRRYGYSVSEIAQWNNLSPPYNLSVGQSLRVAPLSKGDLSTPNYKTQTASQHNTGYHTVARGDTLYSIARNYGYSVSEIAAWNNLSPPYPMSVGQQVRVYPPSGVRLGRNKNFSTSQQSTSARHKANSHTVAPGETLYSIAKHYGNAVSQLIHWNHLRSPYTLSVGQRLQVSSTNTQKSTTSQGQLSSGYYLVKQGDTLRNVAVKYGVDAYELSEWNGISSPYTLYPGQKLLIAPP